VGKQLIILIAGLVAGASLLGMLYIAWFARRGSGMQRMMGSAYLKDFGTPAEVRERLMQDATGEEYERLKKMQKKEFKARKDSLSTDEKYYRAGIFSSKERREYERLRVLIPAITTPLIAFLAFFALGGDFALYGLVFGLGVGLQLPRSILDRKMLRRADDILFYLPLVIEQIAIGVSSSLDVGPCLQRVVAMADERDSHNVVTELIRHAQFHVKSGVSLEEALTEVGTRSGHTELKHSFVALAQVAKHGGEISKQLQELANAVSSQRETKIDAKIRKLELEATGPVALVFLGFIVILLIGFFTQVKKGF
jgi:Flp pilus assembly protein TadB